MFCSNCGAKLDGTERFCRCGTPVTPAPQPLHQPQQPAGQEYHQPEPPTLSDGFGRQNQMPYQAPAGSGGTGGFAARMHSYGASSLFMVGAILYSIGFLNHLLPFTFWNILGIALAVLPVIGVWIVYSSCKTPKTPDGSLPGLTLFKVAAIIGLVFFCIGGGFLILGLILMLVGGAFAVEMLGGGEALMILGLFVFVVIVALFIVWIKFYYVALLNVLKGIRNGLQYGNVRRIEGVSSFTVLSFIAIGFSILGNLSTLAMRGAINALMQEFMGELIREMPRELASTFAGIATGATIGITPILLSLLGSVGLLLLLITLKQFADSIRDNPPV